MLRRAVKSFLVHGSAQKMKSAPMSAVQQEKWDLYASVLVERLPRLTKTLKPIEKQYLEHLNQIEFEQSLKSDFEMREEKDKMIADLQQKGKLEVDMDVAVQQTAQDLKDAWKEEVSRFQLNDRVTEADRKNDTTSLNRKLEDTLVLLVEQNLGQEQHLLLPQGKREAGETMRQTAERVLRERCGDKIEVAFYGNAPCGFYKYKYPKAERTETVGAKVFFYRTMHKSGNIAGANFEWLDKAELQSKLKPAYSSSVSQLIL